VFEDRELADKAVAAVEKVVHHGDHGHPRDSDPRDFGDPRQNLEKRGTLEYRGTAETKEHAV